MPSISQYKVFFQRLIIQEKHTISDKRAFDAKPLAYAYPDLPGTGGMLKSSPAHFIVEELPLFELEGQGDHLYIDFTREGWNTVALIKRMAELLGMHHSTIGYAGLKDRHARVRQSFSLHLPDRKMDAMKDEDVVSKLQASLPIQIHQCNRHAHKLRMGRLRGNRFTLMMTQGYPEAKERAAVLVSKICDKGIPNYFGEQRFGHDGGNIKKGRNLVRRQMRKNISGGRGPRLDKRQSNFMISAYQSYIFNLYLERRMQQGNWRKILPGDAMRKRSGSGWFLAEDIASEQERFEAGETEYGGPLIGRKMFPVTGGALSLENDILKEENLHADDLLKMKSDGSRRAGILYPEDLQMDVLPEGLQFRFSLPAGAYATTVMREIMKCDSDHPIG